jgi:ABC-2 type transport system ATP-binding protein
LDTYPVQLANVSKRFGRIEALRGVSLSAAPGEILALLGPNGAGKTTAIELMLGLRRPDSGESRIFGLDPASPEARTLTGVMLQESGVPGTLRVRELIDLFRAYYPAPMAFDEIVALAGAGDFIDAMVQNLSGGQKQRALFALALAGDPRVLFLDEPSVGLDVETRRALWDHVREIAAQGRTIVLTTHYLEEADALAGRIVILHHGKVIADGTPASLRSKVAGKRVSFETDSDLNLDASNVTSFRREGRRISFLTPEPEPVLKNLFERDLPMRNLTVTGAALEDAFLSLTAEA